MIITGGRLHVRQPGGKGIPQLGTVPQQEHGRGFGDPQKLLRIERDRVCKMQPLHQGRQGLPEGKNATDCGVHMQPDPLTAAKAGDRIQRIHRTSHSGACRRHNRQAASAIAPQC